MKLTVMQENLARALATVGRVANTKTSLPVLSNILLKTEGNRLVLAATNLEIAITEHIGAKVSSEGVITIPARLLGDYVSNLPKSTLTLSLEGTKLSITTDNYRSVMNGMVADEFPTLPKISDAIEIVIDAQEFKRAVQQTILTVSHDETRPILTGIYMHTIDGDLFMAATDGYRLSERKLMALESAISSVVPASAMQDVVRVIPEDCDEIKILVNEQQIKFLINSIEITSRLIDGKYPDYRQLIPKSNDVVFQADKSELVRISKIASLFARESGGSITIKTDKTAGIVSIHSLASQLGENTSEIVTPTSADGSITLNSRYLIEALGVVDGSEVVFGFSGKLAPCVLRANNDMNYTHIIMPLKS